MTTAALVLLIVVSCALTLFLMVCIVAVIKFLQVLKALKYIAEQAEKVVDSAEVAAEMIKKTAGPLALGHLLANLAHAVQKHGRSSKKRRI